MPVTVIVVVVVLMAAGLKASDRCMHAVDAKHNSTLCITKLSLVIKLFATLDCMDGMLLRSPG